MSEEAVIEATFFFNPGDMPPLKFVDDAKITMGTGDDSAFYFDGTDTQLEIDGVLKISEKSTGIDFAQFNSSTRQIDFGQDIAGRESRLVIHGTDTYGIEIRAGNTSVDNVKIFHDDTNGHVICSPGYLNLGGAAARLRLSYNGSSTGAVCIGAANQLIPVAQITGSAPAGIPGGIYYDTTLNKLRVYTGAAYETITSS